jgi:hypothetical protein
VNPKKLTALQVAKIRFIEPMYAPAVQNLPEGKEWSYEIKLDGYRALAGQRLAESKHLVPAQKLLYSPIPSHREILRKT